VPPIVVALAKHPAVDRYDLSKLTTIGSGAAPLGKEVEEACLARIGCHVGQGYGMTETSCASQVSPLDGVRAGSAGVPLPNTECKIVDLATGAALGPREEGEVCLRGPQIMKGYLNRPDATAAMLDPGGWLHTGDIGYCDEDGYLYVVDRVKELIEYKGLQVAPAELEAVLLTHPAVADAAVIPSPDEEAGEVPKAFVVLKSPATAEELGVRRRPRGAAQEDPPGRARGRHPQGTLGQDPAPRADRAGAGAGGERRAIVRCGSLNRPPYQWGRADGLITAPLVRPARPRRAPPASPSPSRARGSAYRSRGRARSARPAAVRAPPRRARARP